MDVRMIKNANCGNWIMPPAIMSTPLSIFQGQGMILPVSLPLASFSFAWRASELVPPKITIASEGAAAFSLPGATATGRGRSMSCTFHCVPGITGVSL